MRSFKVLLLAVAVGLASGAARADVKPNPIFSDNMVVQQGVDVVVYGTGTPGEQFKAGIGKDGGPAVAGKVDKDGTFLVKLPAQKAGFGYVLFVEGKNKVEFKNVAVGEVFICSGQSNMEMTVNSSEDPAKVKAEAKHPEIRLMTVNKRTAPYPITDQADLGHFTKWVECSPETVGNFSAVAYHFGVKLQKELGVPVGLIHTSWGGTPAQAWASLEAMEAVPELTYYAEAGRAAAKKYDEDKKNFDPKKAQAAYEDALAKWKDAAAKAKADGKPVPKEPAKPGNGPAQLGPGAPGVLYNAMIYPLLKFPVKGAIWYQGESNNGKAYEYRTLLPTMIQDWRTRWGGDFPFFIVQLAAFGNGNSNGVTYAELRDAQLYTSQKMKNVGIAVITDVGHETDIHPKPKQPVGERLAISALAIAYGKKITYSGPQYKSLKIEGDKAVVTFDSVGGGLVAKDGELTGFQVAGADNKFVPAKAEIKGDTVVISSSEVSKPVAVRYGWVNFAKPTLNLFNKDGLPASPFRTDEVPYTTAPKK